MPERIGFIGLGTMGAPMARNLLRDGHQLQVFDISRSARASLQEAGARAAECAREAASGVDYLITMLPTGVEVEAALFGEDGALESLDTSALVIDMSTVAPAHTDAIARRLAEAGVAMVDAPVGRSSQHAVEGKLLIMAGGSEADLERARPLLSLLGDTIVHCGPVGAGGRMKIVNNYMSITLNALTAETLSLAKASGLDPELARNVMLMTVAGQGHMSTTYPAKVLNGDETPGFTIDLAHKDLGLALDLAANLNATTLTGAVARDLYSGARRQGCGRRDWTALYRLMADSAAAGE